MGPCLSSNFLLFRTKYVRNLMAFWCILFMRVLMLDFENFSLLRFSYGVSIKLCLAQRFRLFSLLQPWPFTA